MIKRRIFALALICFFTFQDRAAASLDPDWEKSLVKAKCALRTGQLPEAHQYIDLAIVKANSIQGVEDREYSLHLALETKFMIYDAQQQFKMADKILRQTLSITEHYYGSDSPLLANQMSGYAHRFMEHKQFHDAELLFRRSLVIREKLYSHRAELAEDLAGLAKSLEGQHREKEAEEIYVRCLKLYFPACEDLDFRLNNLANCYIAQGKVSEAEPFLKRAQEVAHEFSELRRATKLTDLANRLSAEGQLSESEKEYKRAVQIVEEIKRPSLNKINVLRDYTRFLEKIGRTSEVSKFENQANELFKEYDRIDHQATGLVYQ